MSKRSLMGPFMLVLFFLSCHNTDTTSPRSGQDSASAARDSASIARESASATRVSDSVTRRNALIQALQNLQKTMSSRDKRRIAGLFQFPVSDTILRPTEYDSAFNAEIDSTHPISAAQFDKYFDNFSANWDFPSFDTILKVLDLKKLQKNKKLEFDAFSKKEAIYQYYYILWKNDSLVNLGYGVGIDPHYVPKKGDPEDYDGYLFSMDWSFSFDGLRLRVIALAKTSD